jgi:hypothetical protein
MMDQDRKRRVFLSHWREDADEANWLGAELLMRLESSGMTTEVFWTSRPEYRFHDFEEVVRPRDDWRVRHEAYVDELRTYLERHLATAWAYLLLLTPRSTARLSPWVRWEIQEGTELSRERQIPFVPCLLGVGFEALNPQTSAPSGSPWTEFEVGDLKPDHPEPEFQAVRVDEADGLERVADALRRAWSQQRVLRDDSL